MLCETCQGFEHVVEERKTCKGTCHCLWYFHITQLSRAVRCVVRNSTYTILQFLVVVVVVVVGGGDWGTCRKYRVEVIRWVCFFWRRGVFKAQLVTYGDNGM
jgi:hypothetical protein